MPCVCWPRPAQVQHVVQVLVGALGQPQPDPSAVEGLTALLDAAQASPPELPPPQLAERFLEAEGVAALNAYWQQQEGVQAQPGHGSEVAGDGVPVHVGAADGSPPPEVMMRLCCKVVALPGVAAGALSGSPLPLALLRASALLVPAPGLLLACAPHLHSQSAVCSEASEAVRLVAAGLMGALAAAHGAGDRAAWEAATATGSAATPAEALEGLRVLGAGMEEADWAAAVELRPDAARR